MAARRKYPWEEWFGRPRTILHRGIDYHISQTSMWQSVQNNARLRRVKVRVTDAHESIIIEVVGEENCTRRELPAGRH